MEQGEQVVICRRNRPVAELRAVVGSRSTERPVGGTRLEVLPLPEPPERLLRRLRQRHGIATLPIDEESTTHVTRLPPLHNDPFDRILVSQAIVHGLTLLTPDPLITQYPARVVW